MRKTSADKGLLRAPEVLLAGCFPTPQMFRNQNVFLFIPASLVTRAVWPKCKVENEFENFRSSHSETYRLTGGFKKYRLFSDELSILLPCSCNFYLWSKK